MALAPSYRTLVKFNKNIIKYNWKSINEGPLKRAGLLAKKIERGLIRKDTSKAQRPSKPGKPPKSRHPSDVFRRIFSIPSNLDTNVVIGHMGLYGGQTAMEIQEFGEWVQIKTIVPKTTHLRRSNSARKKQLRQLYIQKKIEPTKTKYTTKMIKMPERPFAAPALARTQKRLPSLWANSVGNATVKQ